MTLSTYEQQRRMRLRWSNFKVLDRNKTRIHWEGELTPDSQPYRIEILHRLNRRSPNQSPMPEVTVTDPLLHRRPLQPEQPIPHVYANRRLPHLPLLCLYDDASSLSDLAAAWCDVG